ncbi:MAG: Ppx/GppA family phosphatase, partial [Pseudomonadota bacterium]
MNKRNSGSPGFDPIYSGRGPTPKDAVAVIDIGSNSIRLVVYDRLDRTPLPIFNEKVLCGLGRGLAESGKLNADGIDLARRNLARFVRLLNEIRVKRLDVLATAAVRDAKDGKSFVATVEKILGREVMVLPGEEEAKLAAYGVVSGIPEASGVVGDLGGGSLELVGLDNSSLTQQITLPLGPFRMLHLTRGKQVEAIDEALDRLDWLDYFHGLDFFPVGGAWRSIAKVHLAESDHPLKVIHGHSVGGRELRRMIDVIARQGDTSLAKLPGVSKRRLETLPYAALLLSRLLRRLKPDRVVFSAYGLREGHLYSLLPAKQQALDPLLHSAGKVDARHFSITHGDDIHEWLTPLFVGESAAAA